MFFQYGTDSNEKQTAEEESQFWAEQLETYLTPYSERLDAYLGRRVVGESDGHRGRHRANALSVKADALTRCSRDFRIILIIYGNEALSRSILSKMRVSAHLTLTYEAYSLTELAPPC